MKEFLPNYFGSEWSFVQYKYNENQKSITHCVFTKQGDIILISETGVFEKILVDYSNATCI